MIYIYIYIYIHINNDRRVQNDKSHLAGTVKTENIESVEKKGKINESSDDI